MKNRILLSGVGIFALAGALGAAPAFAQEGQGPVDTASEESADENFVLSAGPGRPVARSTNSLIGPIAPIDTFAGFQQANFNTGFDGSLNLALPRSAGTITGNITAPDPQLIVRSDIGVAGAVDVNETQPSVVQIFFADNVDGGLFFNCTGTIINPRTVLTAAHCVNASSSEAYGLPGIADATLLIGTGFDTRPRLLNTLNTGATYAEGGVALSTDVIIHPSSNLDNGGLEFPWADVALIALDSPVTDVPAMPILLTPLTELTHVVVTGYGTRGTGDAGGGGIDTLRRVGENMLGAIASNADFIDNVFPGFAPTADAFGIETQALYFIDFDDPIRTPAEQAGCDFTGFDIICNTLEEVKAIDWFPGDALPQEAGTAPGDSGSPLIVDQLYAFPVVAGVLSGGYDFFGTNNRYGDVSFYNPLYPFFQFITQNTPYKYVSANAGDGVWSDPGHWTQDLDPGFFIDDGNGNLVNGIPEGTESGVYETGPKLGNILGNDITGQTSDPSFLLPPEGTPNFGGNLPTSSALLGPGSTGFVPNNTDGTPGVAFANPAQYFEVHLNRAGTTTVDMDVEIDKLVIDDSDAGFVLGSPWSFSSLIGVEQYQGYAEINGSLSTPIYTLASGVLAGIGGTIDTNVLFNVNGLINAGSTSKIGTLAIGGDYVQTSGGALWADFSINSRRVATHDFYDVSGTAVLDGLLILSSSDPRARYGSQFTILSAGAIDGDFSASVSLLNSVTLQAKHRIDGNNVVVNIVSRSFRDLLGSSSTLTSLGGTLDALRVSKFDNFSEMFGIIDNASFASFGDTLLSLTPVSAFGQTFTANAFSQRFTGQISQRTLELRDGSRAAGGFTAAGNASYAIAGTAPAQTGRIGVFGSASGVYVNGGRQGGLIGSGFDGFNSQSIAAAPVQANAFEQAALTQAGEVTVGVDMQLVEGFSFGIAVSNVRNSELSTGLLRAQEDRSTSVAIYATYADGGLFADGYAGTADQRLGVDRASRGDFRDRYTNAIGQSDSEQVFGGLRLGYAFDLARGFEVGPVVSMDYVRHSIGGYDEIGASAFGLSVADRNFTSLGAKAGAMASLDIRTGETGSIRAFGSVAWSRELADTVDVVTARFFGAEDLPFTLENALDPEWVSVNAGAEMALGANLSAALSVTSDMGRGPLSNEQAQATLSWRF